MKELGVRKRAAMTWKTATKGAAKWGGGGSRKQENKKKNGKGKGGSSPPK